MVGAVGVLTTASEPQGSGQLLQGHGADPGAKASGAQGEGREAASRPQELVLCRPFRL